MAYRPVINLLNTSDLVADPYKNDKISCQEVIDYCEAWFHVALQSFGSSTKHDQAWMTRTLFRELVCILFEK